MAIDTEQKRRSSAGIHPLTPILPVPSGDLDSQQTRAALAWAYLAGILGIGDLAERTAFARRLLIAPLSKRRRVR